MSIRSVSLRCAGQIGDVDYGSTFQLTGQTNVKQILLRDGAVSICALSNDGRLNCMGFNSLGELANGQVITETFLPWGDADQRYVKIATGDTLPDLRQASGSPDLLLGRVHAAWRQPGVHMPRPSWPERGPEFGSTPIITSSSTILRYSVPRTATRSRPCQCGGPHRR